MPYPNNDRKRPDINKIEHPSRHPESGTTNPTIAPEASHPATRSMPAVPEAVKTSQTTEATRRENHPSRIPPQDASY